MRHARLVSTTVFDTFFVKRFCIPMCHLFRRVCVALFLFCVFSTGEPTTASAASPVAPPAQAAYGSCGACKYRKEFASGSTHYFKDCSLVKDNIQCSHGLDKDHAWYTSTPCTNDRCWCDRAYVFSVT